MTDCGGRCHGMCCLSDQLNRGVCHTCLSGEGFGENDLRRCGGLLLPPASHESEPVSSGGLNRHESWKHDHFLHAGPDADLKGIGYGWTSLFQQGFRDHPPGTEGAEMFSQVGQFLAGLAAVKAAAPYQHHADASGRGLALRQGAFQ